MTVAARLRSALPERAREPARLALARRLEASTRASSAVRGAALVLHSVAPRGGDPERELDPALDTSRLENLVAYFASRYACVRAADLIPRTRGRAPGEPLPLALTFDDDLGSHLEHAAPVLERHGVAATAFLCGSTHAFWWQALQRAVDSGALVESSLPEATRPLVADALARRPWALARLAEAIEQLESAQRDGLQDRLLGLVSDVPAPLDLEGARALAGHGWEIGFHTVRHDLLPQLDDGRLAAALRDGRGRLPGPPRTLAYPHGKAGARESAAARAAGYEAAFTGAATIVNEDTDPFLIGRLQIGPATVGHFALRLARALADTGAA